MFKKLFKIMSVVTLVATILVACTQDYGSDIAELNQKVSVLQEAVGGLQTAIDNGAVITDVKTTDDGVAITLSDDSVYVITNGRDGENGTVWTIGDNGNWFCDGVDSNKPSQGKDGIDGVDGVDGKDGVDGVDGKDGIDGVDGKDGEDGKDGDYYKPCVDKTSTNYGKWILVNGETGVETVTDELWLPEGTITAVWDTENQTLTLHNVEGAKDGAVTIDFNHILKSIAVIPENFVSGFPYPVVTAYALYVNDEVENYPVSPFTFKYRVNPAGANLDGYEYHVIDRCVTITKATGDNRDNLVPQADVTYDGKDELTLKGFVDFSKYPVNNTVRDNKKQNVALITLEAAKDDNGKESVVSDYAAIMLDFAIASWTAYSRYTPDAEVTEWTAAPCKDNNWYAEDVTFNGVDKTIYKENDILPVSDTYDVAAHMRFADPTLGILETLGFTVKYTYEVYKGEDGTGFGASDMIECTEDGKVSVKEGDDIAGVVGQYVMVTAKASIHNDATDEWVDADVVQYTLFIVPDSTDAVDVTCDLGEIGYSTLVVETTTKVNAVLEALDMNLDGFTNVYTTDPVVTSTEYDLGFEYVYTFGVEDFFAVKLNPTMKIGKGEIVFSFVPNSDEYPVVNYTIAYDITFDVEAPILNQDYVLYDANGNLVKTIITPNPGVDSLVSVKGKSVGGRWRQRATMREHIKDYAQDEMPNVERLFMSINFEKSNQPEGSARIATNNGDQEIRLESIFGADETYKDYVIDMNITLVNGETYMVKQYIVRFVKPFYMVTDDITLETHRMDECTASATYKVYDIHNVLVYDSETGATQEGIDVYGIRRRSNGGRMRNYWTTPVWTLNIDDSFGGNLTCDDGVFTWENDGAALQSTKYTSYEVSQTFTEYCTVVGTGGIKVLSSDESHTSHADE